jgi:hypothetical protein
LGRSPTGGGGGGGGGGGYSEMLPYVISVLKIEEFLSSERLANFYQPTSYDIPKPIICYL